MLLIMYSSHDMLGSTCEILSNIFLASRAWHFEEKGFFTVKSAYRVKRRLDDVALQGQMGSCAPHCCEDWTAIWKLECPGKIKLFLWRIAHNSMRTSLVKESPGGFIGRILCISSGSGSRDQVARQNLFDLGFVVVDQDVPSSPCI